MTGIIKRDAFFKKTFEMAEVQREFIQAHLPKEIVELVDMNRIKRINGSFVEENLRQKHSDIILQVGLKTGESAYIYTLVEHQSTPDPKMPLRAHQYVCTFAQKLWKNGEKLPIIYPVILYHGRTKYNAPLGLHEMFENPELMKSLLEKIPVIELSEISDEVIEEYSWLGMVELSLKHIFNKNKIEFFKKILNLFRIDKKAKSLLFEIILCYNSKDIIEEEYNDILELIKKEEDGEVHVGTMSQVWKEEGIQEGIEIGVQKGVEIGVQKGKHLGLQEGKYLGLQEGKYLGLQEGKHLGLQEGMQKVAIQLLKKGHKIEDIAEITGLYLEEIERLNVS